MSVFIALSVERTTHVQLSTKELFWNIYFEIDVLRVNVALRYKWLSAKNIPEYKRSRFLF